MDQTTQLARVPAGAEGLSGANPAHSESKKKRAVESAFLWQFRLPGHAVKL
jgi:hypothetical protein